MKKLQSKCKRKSVLGEVMKDTHAKMEDTHVTRSHSPLKPGVTEGCRNLGEEDIESA